jgi:cytoskeletal protein RodZ
MGEDLRSERFGWRDQEWFREGDPRSSITNEQRRFGPHFFFGPLMFLVGLAKLIGLGLLIWLLFRLFTQKRNQSSGSAGAPPASFTPHDPRVE